MMFAKISLGIIFLAFASLTFSQSGNKTSVKVPSIKKELAPTVDSLNTLLKRGQQLTNETKQTIDSIKELNAYLNKLLISHNYRVYTYPDLRLKLVYKWHKGTPGHWYKMKEIHY